MKDEAIAHYEAALKEAFPTGASGDVFHHWNEARKALEQEKALQALHNENERLGLYKDAYGQPEPEPVVWGVDWSKAGDSPCVSIIKRLPGDGIKVVAVEYGPKREWQGLTDDEIEAMGLCAATKADIQDIEAKLKEKNT